MEKEKNGRKGDRLTLYLLLVPREPALAEPPEKRPREPNEENDIPFDQLIDQIQDINATPFWNCIQNDQGVTFLNINQDPNNAPQLKYSVTVKPDLTGSVYCYSTKTTKLSGDFWIPTTITSLKTLVDLLDNIRAFDKSATSSGTGKKKDAILGLILSLCSNQQLNPSTEQDDEHAKALHPSSLECQNVSCTNRRRRSGCKRCYHWAEISPSRSRECRAPHTASAGKAHRQGECRSVLCSSKPEGTDYVCH
ncbi:hypothetical protein HPB47_016417 [Ixodes persulcatus]|uniref:Uncharacterized protein n=1 Tax=Ixodes persulcatus TaxID=34615 RepID=A0AC60QQY8_IXOPE|nr:hypothetical protein HPB47_016417 [Ixodes persulcatus]